MEEAVRLLGVDESGDWRWHEKPLMTGMARSSSGPSCKSYAPPTPRRFHRFARREKKLSGCSHRASRAPVGVHITPLLFTLHPHDVSAHALSSPRGIGILAPAPRCDQRAGGRRTRRTPPTHTSYPQGTNAARLHRRKSCPPPPVHPLSTFIARHPCRESSPSTSTQYNHRSSRSG